MPDNFDIVVVTSIKRKPLIIQYLSGLDAIVSVTPDYELNQPFKPMIGGLVQNHTGAYRCFRGHQAAIAKSTKDVVLVFEDDAVPNREDWLKVVSDSVKLLETFEMVSFHGRQFIPEVFNTVNNDFIKPKNRGSEWIVAALAYLIPRRVVNKLIEYKYNGMPWDLLLYRELNYCLMKKSAFNHDRTRGSLIDTHGE